ncbi:MAG TPA: di-trans,poly-cis-decaprenylcistransferase [Candidatus Acidoferrales bacterium]|jgi:undecaprenyl diphosphate synthase|nr:di-trans,poly-cis-decaprenylcistransferase [Candidatus Acidoferrales bacterium]
MVAQAITEFPHPTPKLHVAILLDGNGRWALSRGLPRVEGHRAGMAAVRRIVRAAPDLGIGTLSLYAFSSNNWDRPSGEVTSLLGLLESYLRNDASDCAAQGVRLRIIGRRDRIPPSLVEAIETAERTTAGGRKLELRIALDYSSRDAILRAACWMVSSLEVTDKEFARRLGQVTHAGGSMPDVDLLIRTGGERRLSDFLLWECAYAELLFTPRMWPEFDAADLAAAVKDFLGRERRFGRLPEAAAS